MTYECTWPAWGHAVVRGRAGHRMPPLTTVEAACLARWQGRVVLRHHCAWAPEVWPDPPILVVTGYLIPGLGSGPSVSEQDHLDKAVGSSGCWQGLGSIPPVVAGVGRVAPVRVLQQVEHTQAVLLSVTMTCCFRMPPPGDGGPSFFTSATAAQTPSPPLSLPDCPSLALRQPQTLCPGFSGKALKGQFGSKMGGKGAGFQFL